MNKSRWMFETWQIALSETQKTNQFSKVGEIGFKALQNMLVNLFGLNLEPVIDDTKPVDSEGKPAYRWTREGEFTPMMLGIARPDYIKQAFEKIEKVQEENRTEAPLENDYSEEDLEFFDEIPVNPKKSLWESATTQAQLKDLVIPLDAKTVDPRNPIQPKPPGASDAERQRQAEEQGFSKAPRRASTFRVDPDTEDLLKYGELKKDV
jgi:hypothetical protein